MRRSRVAIDFKSRQGGLPTGPVLGRDMGFVSGQRGLQFKTKVCRDRAFFVTTETTQLGCNIGPWCHDRR